MTKQFKRNTIAVSWEPFAMDELASMGVTGQHAFLIYTDAAGVNHVLEHGDPYYAYGDSQSLYQGELKDFLRYRVGRLSAAHTYPHPEGTREGIDQNNVIYKATPKFPNWHPLDNYFDLNIPVQYQKQAWQEMIDHAKALKDAKVLYQFGLKGPVSNSVIASVLADIGLQLDEITGVNIPENVSLNNPASIGMAVMAGKLVMSDLGYGGVSNTVDQVQSADQPGLARAISAGANGSTPDTATTDPDSPLISTPTQPPSSKPDLATPSISKPAIPNPETLLPIKKPVFNPPDSVQTVLDSVTHNLSKPKHFKKKFVDKITNFNPELDDLQLDVSDFGLRLRDVEFKIVANKKQLKKFLRKDFSFIYESRKGGLYFNENKAEKGVGEGGLFAILKGGPDLIKENFEIV